MKSRSRGGAYEFQPGNRIRLALSTTYWPMVWPEPRLGGVTIYPDANTFSLPAMTPSSEQIEKLDDLLDRYSASLILCNQPPILEAEEILQARGITSVWFETGLDTPSGGDWLPL